MASRSRTIPGTAAGTLGKLAYDLVLYNSQDLGFVNLPKEFTSLPVLRILTKDAAPILTKETYVAATFTLTNPAAGADVAALNGKIRGRGNSTWGKPKNPYKVQFTDDAAYARVPDFLGMKKNRNWALLADYFDQSLLRNKLALSLGASSVFADGLKWTPAGQHLEVWLNGDYVGSVTIGGAGGQTDPTKIAVRDLSKTEQEPLLKRVRKLLRVNYGFPRGEKNKFNVDAVFSMEPLKFPEDDASCSLDADQRKSIDSRQFAFPKQRKEPLENASHVRNAIARFDQVEGVSDADRDAAWKRIKAAAKKHGVEVSEKSWRELGKPR